MGGAIGTGLFVVSGDKRNESNFAPSRYELVFFKTVLIVISRSIGMPLNGVEKYVLRWNLVTYQMI